MGLPKLKEISIDLLKQKPDSRYEFPVWDIVALDQAQSLRLLGVENRPNGLLVASDVKKIEGFFKEVQQLDLWDNAPVKREMSDDFTRRCFYYNVIRRDLLKRGTITYLQEKPDKSGIEQVTKRYNGTLHKDGQFVSSIKEPHKPSSGQAVCEAYDVIVTLEGCDIPEALLKALNPSLYEEVVNKPKVKGV